MVVEEEVGEEVEEVGKREMGEREFVRDAFTVTTSTRFFTKPGNCTKPRFSRFKDGRRTGEGRTNGGRTDGRTERRADGRKDGRADGRRTCRKAREKGGGRQGRGGGSSSMPGSGDWRDGSFFVETKEVEFGIEVDLT